MGVGVEGECDEGLLTPEDNPMLDERIVNSRPVFRGGFLNVDAADIVLPNGNEKVHEVIRHPGAVAIIALDGEGRILLVHQYRTALERVTIEIPAGKLNAGEEPALAAARELEEEAGIRADCLTLLFTMYPTPGYTNEKIYIYRAESGTHTSAHLDEGEFLTAEFLPEETVKRMLESGEINDGKTIIALQAYFLSLKN